jgi:hypothetical protein
MFQLHQIHDGIGSPIDDGQILSGVFKPNAKMTLRINANTFSVDANTVDGETLHLEGTAPPNRFGGADVFGSANAYSGPDISYLPH